MIRVRRSSDQAETDVGYDENGNLNTPTLLAFVGAGDRFVSKIYDQSGLARDLKQSVAGNQRQIVTTGTINNIAGTPAIESTGDPISEVFRGYNTNTFSPTYDSKIISSFARFLVTNGAWGGSRILSIVKNNNSDYILPSINLMQIREQHTWLRAETNGGSSPSILGDIYTTLGSMVVASSICDGAFHTTRSNTASNAVSFAEPLSINRVFAAGQYVEGGYKGFVGEKWVEALLYFSNKTADEYAILEALT